MHLQYVREIDNNIPLTKMILFPFVKKKKYFFLLIESEKNTHYPKKKILCSRVQKQKTDSQYAPLYSQI